MLRSDVQPILNNLQLVEYCQTQRHRNNIILNENLKTSIKYEIY